MKAEGKPYIQLLHHLNEWSLPQLTSMPLWRSQNVLQPHSDPLQHPERRAVDASTMNDVSGNTLRC